MRVQHNGRTTDIGVVPDKVFGLRAPGQLDLAWYFLETDRTTMPVHRNNLKQTPFRRKLLAYLETWRQGVLRDRFPRFRVLTVTTSAERIENLIEATGSLTRGTGSGLFLFADEQWLSAAEPLLEQPLQNGRGEEVAMLT